MQTYATVLTYVVGSGTTNDPFRLKCSDDIVTDGQEGSWRLADGTSVPVMANGDGLVSTVLAEPSALTLISGDPNQEILFETPDVLIDLNIVVPDVAMGDKVRDWLLAMGYTIPQADSARSDFLLAASLLVADAQLNSYLVS